MDAMTDIGMLRTSHKLTTGVGVSMLRNRLHCVKAFYGGSRTDGVILYFIRPFLSDIS